MDDNPLTRAVGPAIRLVALLGGYAVLALAFFVCAEVILRRAVGISLQGADEFGGYVLAGMAAFGFAYALMERSHTRIELLLERLPNRAVAGLDALAVLAVAGMAAFMAWRGVAVVMESIEFRSLSGTPSMTPLWRPQAIWAAGLIVFAAFAAAAAIHALRLLIVRPDALRAWYGARTLDEEIAEEKRSVERRGAGQ